MPKGGLEPPRVAPYAPQTYVSTSSTTSAISSLRCVNYFLLVFPGLADSFAGAGLLAAFWFTGVFGTVAGCALG